MDYLKRSDEAITSKDKEPDDSLPTPEGRTEEPTPDPVPDVPEQEAKPAPVPDAATPSQSSEEHEKGDTTEVSAEQLNRTGMDKSALLEAFGSMDAALKDFTRQFKEILAQQEQILSSMAEIQTSLPGLEEGLPKLQEAILGVQYDRAVERLCRLHQAIVLRNRVKQDPDLALMRDELARILSEEFALEAIHPKRGEQFDAEREMRVREDMPPGRVDRCLAVGWMLRSQAVLRALVETIYLDYEEGGF